MNFEMIVIWSAIRGEREPTYNSSSLSIGSLKGLVLTWARNALFRVCWRHQIFLSQETVWYTSGNTGKSIVERVEG